MSAVTVRLFARFAELLGQDVVAFDMTPGETVGSLLARFRERIPGADLLPDTPLVAVNLKQAGPDQSLHPGDEVALLPPLAGG